MKFFVTPSPDDVINATASSEDTEQDRFSRGSSESIHVLGSSSPFRESNGDHVYASETLKGSFETYTETQTSDFEDTGQRPALLPFVPTDFDIPILAPLIKRINTQKKTLATTAAVKLKKSQPRTPVNIKAATKPKGQGIPMPTPKESKATAKQQRPAARVHTVIDAMKPRKTLSTVPTGPVNSDQNNSTPSPTNDTQKIPNVQISKERAVETSLPSAISIPQPVASSFAGSQLLLPQFEDLDYAAQASVLSCFLDALRDRPLAHSSQDLHRRPSLLKERLVEIKAHMHGLAYVTRQKSLNGDREKYIARVVLPANPSNGTKRSSETTGSQACSTFHSSGSDHPVPLSAGFGDYLTQGMKYYNSQSLPHLRRAALNSMAPITACARGAIRCLRKVGEVACDLNVINEIKFNKSHVVFGCSANLRPENATNDLYNVPTLRSSSLRQESQTIFGTHYHFGAVNSANGQYKVYDSVRDVLLLPDDKIFSIGDDNRVSLSSINGTQLDSVQYQVALDSNSAPLPIGGRLAHSQAFPNIVASASENGPVSLYDLRNTNPLQRPHNLLQKNTRTVSDLLFGRGQAEHLLFSVFFSGARIGSKRTCAKSTVNIWAINSLRPFVTRELNAIQSAEDISSIAINPHGNLIVAGHTFKLNRGQSSGKLRIHSLETCHVTHEFTSNQEDVNVVGFSPCGRFTFSAATDNSCVVFDLRFPKRKYMFASHGPAATTDTLDEAKNIYRAGLGIVDAHWLQDSDLLSTAGADGNIRFWDVKGSDGCNRHDSRRRGSKFYHEIGDSSGVPVSRMRVNADETMFAAATGPIISLYSCTPHLYAGDEAQQPDSSRNLE